MGKNIAWCDKTFTFVYVYACVYVSACEYLCVYVSFVSVCVSACVRVCMRVCGESDVGWGEERKESRVCRGVLGLGWAGRESGGKDQCDL